MSVNICLLCTLHQAFCKSFKVEQIVSFSDNIFENKKKSIYNRNGLSFTKKHYMTIVATDVSLKVLDRTKPKYKEVNIPKKNFK